MQLKDIRPGTKLDLEVINSLGERIGKTYISQIIDVLSDKDLKISAPIHESRLLLLTTGTRVRCILIHDKLGLLGFEAKVKSKEKENSLILIHLELDGPIDKIQRRNYFRLDALLPVLYRVIPKQLISTEPAPPPPDTWTKGFTRNLSGSGVGLILAESLDPGALVEVSITIPDNDPIRGKATVMRSVQMYETKERRYDVGLHFNDINQQDRNLIVRYVFEQQKQALKRTQK